MWDVVWDHHAFARGDGKATDISYGSDLDPDWHRQITLLFLTQLNNPGSPHPDVQLVLDALMADNVILKRDNAELRELLSESQTQAAVRHLHSNSSSPQNRMARLDSDLSISTYAYHPEEQSISRSSTAFFSDELAASTASSRQPQGIDQAMLDSFGHGRKGSWNPSIGSGGGSGGGVVRRHGRNDSWTPSIASGSSYGMSAGMRSPTLEDDSGNFTDGGSRKYPLGAAGRRSSGRGSGSSSFGSSSWTRGHVKRSYSVDRPKGVQRAFSVGCFSSIYPLTSHVVLMFVSLSPSPSPPPLFSSSFS